MVKVRSGDLTSQRSNFLAPVPDLWSSSLASLPPLLILRDPSRLLFLILSMHKKARRQHSWTSLLHYNPLMASSTTTRETSASSRFTEAFSLAAGDASGEDYSLQGFSDSYGNGDARRIGPLSLPLSSPLLSPSSYFAIPAGLSPTGFLDSPDLLSFNVTAPICTWLGSSLVNYGFNSF